MDFITETPLLSLMTAFFGHLGYYLHPLEHLSNWSTCLRLLLNLSLNFLILFTFSILDPFGAKQYYIDYSIPWKVFIYYDTLYLAPLAYLLLTLFYALKGRSIVDHLSWPLFTESYRREGVRVKVVALGLLFGQHWLYYSIFYELILMEWSQFQPVILLNLFTCYLSYLSSYVALSFVYYFQHGTYRILQTIHQDLLTSNCSSATQSATLLTLSRLSLVNDSLYSLLSFPIGLFITVTLLDSIASLTMGHFLGQNGLLNFTQWGVNLLYLLYLIHQNAANWALLKRIIALLRQSAFTTSLWKQLFTRTTPLARSESADSQCIRPFELHLYLPYFTFRLSRLCVLDYELFLSLLIFLANYVLLIVQTSATDPNSYLATTKEEAQMAAASPIDS